MPKKQAEFLFSEKFWLVLKKFGFSGNTTHSFIIVESLKILSQVIYNMFTTSKSALFHFPWKENSVNHQKA